jgi:3-methyladenine DNA glycosylase AlkD
VNTDRRPVPGDGGRVQPDRELIAAVTERLAAAADPGRAPQMQAYMKSAMPFLGVPVPAVRAVVKQAAREHPPASVAQLAATALALWRGAPHREYRYAATALTGLRMADGDLALVPVYEEMVVSGAWWDHVAAVAPRLGRLLLVRPVELRPLLLAWSTAPDRWLRRASIIAQLRLRARTDPDLLARVIDTNAADPDLFLRKAIGWALRDYARTDPEWVSRFVAARSATLSALSRREATKHLT